MSYKNLLLAPDSSKFRGVIIALPQESMQVQSPNKYRYVLVTTFTHSLKKGFSTPKTYYSSFSPKKNGYYKPSQSSLYLKLQRKLQTLKTIKSDWDGYDSPKPNLHAFANARTIIDIAHTLNNFPTSITPSVEGGIGLTFEGSSKYAVVECFNDGDISAIGSNRKGETKSWTLAGSDNELQQTIEEINAYVGK